MGKLFFVMVLCLGLTGVAGAIEVINIDINGSASDPCYSGTAAFVNEYCTDDEWIGYDTGNGIMMASPRSVGIGNAGVPSIYARAFFIADPCAHGTTASGVGDLLGDGHSKSGAAADPNPGLFIWGAKSYGGIYDVYVLAGAAGSFTITDSNGTTQSDSLDGGTEAAWVEGDNYVVFEDVWIDTPASWKADSNEQDPSYAYLTDPNCVQLTYSNEINGIQFANVRRRMMALTGTPGIPPNDGNLSTGNWSDETPIDLGPLGRWTNVSGGDYDRAYETNLRTSEFDLDGPDMDWSDGDGAGDVHYIDSGEWMEYDVLIDDVSDGYYTVRARVNCKSGNASISLYIDDSGQVALLEAEAPDDPNEDLWTNFDGVNFFQGLHRFRWKANQAYFDILALQFRHYRDQTGYLMETCEDVVAYGFGLAGDASDDCYVNFEDLKLVADNWANCNDPEGDPNDCIVEEPAW